MKTASWTTPLMTVLLVTCYTLPGKTQPHNSSTPIGPSAHKWEKAVTQAINYFKITAQEPNGSYSSQTGPAVTALVVTSILKSSNHSSESPFIKQSLSYLMRFARNDGGLYAKDSVHGNYETALSLLAFKTANDKNQFGALVKDAQSYLIDLQWDETEDKDSSNSFFGGAGYGRHERPDLSNTQFLIEALKASGLAEDHPTMQRALVFVSRCQNLESEHNTLPFATQVEDGGFYYTPAAGGTSQAGKTANGGLRSYGSMTYAGLKSMIFAGLTREDPRVQAAYEWICNHYTIKENPGMGYAGLYYYYHTFAKALNTLNIDFVEDDDGLMHDWRKDLANELFIQQRADGSWINRDNKRWYEGDPNLVTAYGLLALSYCKPKTTSP